MIEKKYYSGQGKMYLTPVTKDGKQGKTFWVGNVPELSLSTEETKEEHKESHSGARSVDYTIVTETKTTVSYTLEDSNRDVIEVALKGLASTVQAQNAQTYQAKQVVNGDVVKLPFGLKSAEASGYEFEFTRSGFVTIKSGAEIAKDIDIEYSTDASVSIKAGLSEVDYFIADFDGLNTAASNEPVHVRIYRLKPSIAETFSLISDDIRQLPVTADALSVDGVAYEVNML